MYLSLFRPSFAGFKGGRSYFALLPACVLMLLAAFPNSPTNAQSAEKILKQATKAAGGEKAIKRIKSWAAAGAVTRTRDGATGEFAESATQPNLYRISLNLGGEELGWTFNGKSSWSRNAQALSTLTGDASRDFQLRAAYRNYRWLNYKSDKSKASFGGQSKIGGVAVNRIALTTIKNAKLNLYFDARTGLLLRDEMLVGATTVTTDYGDYRAIDGVMEPFQQIIHLGEDEYTVALNGVLHNGTTNRALFEQPRFSNEPLPDIPALLKAVTANQDHLEKVLENYTYTETTSERELDDRGVMREKESETYELTFYQGARIRRLVAKNHQPLSAADQAKEDKRIERFLEDLEQRLAKREARARAAGRSADDPDSEDKDRRVSLAQILHVSKLTNPRREIFRERPVIVFDFEPDTSYKPQKDYEKFLGKTAGVIWVDDADRQIVRMEARLIDAFKIGGGLLASLQKGGTFVFDQQRVNNEIWLPTSMEINFSAKVLLLKTITGNQLTTFGNYQRFNTEVNKAEVNSTPAEPGSQPTPTPTP